MLSLTIWFFLSVTLISEPALELYNQEGLAKSLSTSSLRGVLDATRPLFDNLNPVLSLTFKLRTGARCGNGNYAPEHLPFHAKIMEIDATSG